jgi:hypothetical protein
LPSPWLMWHSRHMDTQATTTPYKCHRVPGEIISHGVWLYFRCALSYRDVEELQLARGVIVTSEAIRKWCCKFGQAYANQLRCRRPSRQVTPNVSLPPMVPSCNTAAHDGTGSRPQSTARR